MADLIKNSRVDQIVISFDSTGKVRGAHALNYLTVHLDGELLSDRSEVAPFDPACVSDLLPSAHYIQRVLDLEAELAKKSQEAEEYKAKAEELSANFESAQKRLEEFLVNTQIGRPSAGEY